MFQRTSDPRDSFSDIKWLNTKCLVYCHASQPRRGSDFTRTERLRYTEQKLCLNLVLMQKKTFFVLTFVVGKSDFVQLIQSSAWEGCQNVVSVLLSKRFVVCCLSLSNILPELQEKIRPDEGKVPFFKATTKKSMYICFISAIKPQVVWVFLLIIS